MKTTINGNILTVEEFSYPTHHFEIVDKVPVGYVVWNIGKHMPEGYIAYCQVGGYNGCCVNTETLKALKVNKEA